jgi:hypothetical protein
MAATGVLQRTNSGAFASDDAAFSSVVGSTPALIRLVDVDAHEGPTYLPDQDALFVTTVPRRSPTGTSRAQVKRVALDGDRFLLEPDRVSVVAADAVMPNGMTRGADGGLVLCDQGDLTHDARLSRVDPRTAATTTIVDAWHGRPLNSPNDVAVRGDGTIWFTDPSYGHLQGFRPTPASRDCLYRLDPATGGLLIVADHLDKPNGLVFSPDQSVLFNWYRLAVTIPERIGDLDPTGCTVVFEVVVDDYAEVWVDGRLPAALGDTGGPVIAGFNAPNRVILTRDGRPGQTFRVAVFGGNGTISAAPRNYIWLRGATLDFFTAPDAAIVEPAPHTVTRGADGLDEFLTPGTALERVAGGFEFTEGPVWAPTPRCCSARRTRTRSIAGTRSGW